MNYTNKTKEELIEELKLLRKKIADNAVYFPGHAVIEKYEREVSKSENLSKQSIEEASDAIFIADEKGYFIGANKKAELLSGYSKTGLEKKAVTDLFTSTQKSPIYESSLKNKKGKLTEIEISHKRFKDGRIQFIVRDITERKKIQNELQHSEAQWQSLFEYIPDLILVINPQGEIINSNRSGLGFERDVLVGKNAFEIINHSSRQLKNAVKELLLTKKLKVFESTINENNKDLYSIRLSPVINENKVSYITIILTNISEQRKSTLQFYKSEERFKKLSESSFEGILIHKNGIIMEANDAFYNMFGYEPGEIYGKNALILSAPESYELVKGYVEKNHEGPYEAVGIKKDGSRIIVELSGRQIPYKNEIARMVSLRDITVNKSYEQVLTQSEKQYRQLFEQNPMPMLLCSEDGDRIINANNAAKSYFGFGNIDLNEKTVTGLFSKTDAKKLEDIIRSLGRKKQVISEFNFIAKSKEKHCLRVYIQRFFGDESLCLVIFQDITDKKLHEEKEKERELLVQKQNKVLVELAKQVSKTVESKSILEKVLNKSCQTLGLSVVGVWLFNGEGVLECLLQYESDKNEFSSSATINSKDHPDYFKAIETERLICVNDTFNDHRTISFRDSYMIPYDVRSMMDVPLRVNGKPVGVFCFEQRETQRNWLIEEQNFASSVADLVVISFEAREKRKAEEALLESESSFRMLAQNAIDIIFRYDVSPDNRYTYLSPSVEQISGYSPQEFYDDPYLGFNIIHPDDRHLIAAFENELDTKKHRRKYHKNRLQLRWIRKDGKVIWLETRNRTIFKNGILVAVEGVMRDITERVTGEENLKESEQRFRLLSAVALEGIVIAEKGIILDANDRFVSMHGYDRSEAIGASLSKLVSNDVLSGVELTIDCKTEITTKAKAGNVLHVEVLSSKIPHEGRVVDVFVFTDITARKEYEIELEKSRENYKEFIEASPDALFIHDDKSNIIFANPSALKLFGVENINELIGLSIYSFVPVEYHELIDTRRSLVKKGVNVPFISYPIVKPDGSLIEIESKPVLYDHQGSRSYLVFCHDISYQRKLEKEQLRAEIAEGANKRLLLEVNEHKKTQKKLRETEKYTRNIIESSLDMICAADVNGYITEFNRAAQLCFGYSYDEIIGKHFSVLFDDENEYRNKMLGLSKSGGFKGEIINKRKNGESFIAYLAASLLVNNEGAVVGSMGVSRDVSLLKEAERELRLSEEKYKAIYNQAYIGIARVGLTNGDFIEVNQRLCDILGYSASELTAMTTWDITHPEDLYTNWPERNKFLKSNSSKLSTEKRYVHKNGSTIYANLTISLVSDANGNPDYFVSVYEDVTEKKIAEEKIKISEERYRDLFENATDLIQSIDASGKILYVNNAWKNTLGYSDSDIAELNIFEIIHPEYTSICKSACKKVFEGQEVNKVEIAFITKAGKTILAEGNLNCSSKSGIKMGARGIFRDITDRKIAEEKTKSSEERYKAIYSQVYIGIAIVSLDGRFIQANQQLCGVLGYSEKEMRSLRFIDITHPDSLDLSIDFQHKLIKGDITNFTTEKKYLHKNGSVVYMNLTSSVVNDSKGRPDYFLSVFQDITARKKAEEKIRIQSSKLKAIFETSSHIIWTVDSNVCLTSFNKNYADHVKRLYGVDVYIGFKTNDSPMLSSESYNEFWNQKYIEVFKGNPQQFETSLADSNGNVTWREIFLNPIYDENNIVVEVSGIGHDITEKKHSEEKVKQSLKEKEVLLKEVHHRVKNNLQVISSILNLQSSYVKDKYTLQMLRESQDRIKSMSFIHECLYQTKDFTSINFADYIINLSKNLVHSYRIYEGHIDLSLNVEPVHLNLDLAIPSGLIINELVSNALKYAFPEGSKGVVSISINEVGDNIELLISDNGIGLPKEIDFRNTESLGLQLVNTLVEQINGEISMQVNNGTEFHIKFCKTLQ